MWAKKNREEDKYNYTNLTRYSTIINYRTAVV